MRIAFWANHSYYGGLNNTGGTRTIVRSAQALRGLGHEVDIIARRDRYTWEPHPAPRKKIAGGTDVVVAASISDLYALVEKDVPYPLAYWARGWEKWQMPDRNIIKTVRKLIKRRGTLLCNSSWLVERFQRDGLPAQLCFSGLDLDEMGDDKVYREGKRLTVGCLRPNKGRHTTLHRTKGWRQCYELAELLGRDARMLAYGANPDYAPHWVEKYLREPSVAGKRMFYNCCHVWFSPSTLEGFHNPPAEAALCGCLVVAVDVKSGGTYDYATEETAHRWPTVEEAARMIRNADYSRVAKCQERLRQIGDRTTNMRRFVALLQEGL